MRGFDSSLCLCAVFALLNSDVALGYVVWNFGHDTPDSYVVGHLQGGIQFLEKSKRIPLNVAPCHEVTLVRVEVDNFLSTPSVRYDESARTVVISYSILQNSASSYDILIKGRLIPGCVGTGNRHSGGCRDAYGKPIACDDDNLDLDEE